MAEQLSREAKLKYGSNTVAGLTSLSFSIDGNVIETNNFDTGLITQARKGRVTITASASFQVYRSDTNGQDAIRADFLDSSKSIPSDFEAWTIEPETPATGDTKFTGACIITSYSEEGSDDGDGLLTGSFELRLTSFTESTVA